MRKMILIAHPYWGRGGAEISAMWLLQALCCEYQVDIVTRGGWDLEDLNRCAGTAVKINLLGNIIMPPFVPGFGVIGGALWQGLYLRYCRYLGRLYDVRITASRAIDWGRPAIHFLSDVVWNDQLQKRFGCPEAPRFSNLLRRVYFQFGKWLAGASGRDPAHHDVFAANSKWTADISSIHCARPPVVIYPPVPGAIHPVPWSEREDSFLCLGRIAPEKRLEQVIAILDELRILGHPVRLRIVGTGDDAEYLRQIQSLCEDRKDWVVFHGPLYGAEKEALLARCRYGISACDREAFGIATAEMMKCGIIPFVPIAGAQSEIVRERALIYGDIQDAVLKIVALFECEDRKLELHAAMMHRGLEFDTEGFCVAVRNLVKEELGR